VVWRVTARTWARWRGLAGPIAILLLALVLRVAWPTLTEFKFSEARLEALALEITQGGRLPLVGVPSSAGFDHSPISVYLYVPAFLWTADPVPATLYGGLIGLAAVGLCWWLARRWSRAGSLAGPGRGATAAWIAALLFATSPWAVVFSRKIWQVVFVPVLALAFVGLIVSALVEEPGRRWNLAWALVVYALLVQVHPSAVSLAPALVLWLVLFWRRIRAGPLAVGALLAALTAVPFLVHQVEHGWPVLAALENQPAPVWDGSALRLAWEAITGRGIHALAGDAYPLLDVVPRLAWTFNLVGWLVVGSALWLARRIVAGWRATDREVRQRARIDLVLLSWLVVPILFSLRHSLDLHLHFFVLLVPAAYLVVGRAAADLLARSQRRHVVTLAALPLGLLAAGQIVALVWMGRFVATHDTPGGFGVPLGRYFATADRAASVAQAQGAAEVLVVGQGDSVVVDETPAIYDVLLRGRVAYRFVDGQSAALFPTHRALALVTSGAGEAARWYLSGRPLLSAPGDGDRLVLVEGEGGTPQQQLEPIAGLRLFQNGVELQGYSVEEPALGGQVRFWLLWQVLWLSPGDTHFFVHLLDAEGRMLGQQDSAGYPPAYRQKGDRVVNMFDIKIRRQALPDPYWARVGLYLYPEVSNVPAIDAAGNPATDTVTVGPLSRRP
jgi:hypothetical protein